MFYILFHEMIENPAQREAYKNKNVLNKQYKKPVHDICTGFCINHFFLYEKLH